MKTLPRRYVVLICLVVAAFIAFVWPTPYWYTHVGDSVYRINRFTGSRERIIEYLRLTP